MFIGLHDIILFSDLNPAFIHIYLKQKSLCKSCIRISQLFTAGSSKAPVNMLDAGMLKMTRCYLMK